MLWQKLLGTDRKEIQYVGGITNGFQGRTTNNTVLITPLTGGLASAPAQGDLVIVYFGNGSTADDNLVISGYTELVELFSNDSTDTNMVVAYKYMTATPDTSITLVGGSAGVDNAGTLAVQVFRNAVISTEQASATGNNGGRPNPPSVTPTATGSVVVAGGAAGYSGIAADFTNSNLTNFITESQGDTNDSTVGMGYHVWVSGAFDPGQFGGGSTDTGASWAAYTLTIKPA